MNNTKKVIQTPRAPQPVARYSQGIMIGNTLYVQGMVALLPGTTKLIAGGIREQAEQVFDNIQAVLEAAGLAFKHVVKVTAFLADLKDYPSFNEIYNRRFQNDAPPVRTTVQAALPLGALLEVEVIAVNA